MLRVGSSLVGYLGIKKAGSELALLILFDKLLGLPLEFPSPKSSKTDKTGGKEENSSWFWNWNICSQQGLIKIGITRPTALIIC